MKTVYARGSRRAQRRMTGLEGLSGVNDPVVYPVDTGGSLINEWQGHIAEGGPGSMNDWQTNPWEEQGLGCFMGCFWRAPVHAISTFVGHNAHTVEGIAAAAGATLLGGVGAAPLGFEIGHASKPLKTMAKQAVGAVEGGITGLETGGPVGAAIGAYGGAVGSGAFGGKIAGPTNLEIGGAAGVAGGTYGGLTTGQGLIGSLTSKTYAVAPGTEGAATGEGSAAAGGYSAVPGANSLSIGTIGANGAVSSSPGLLSEIGTDLLSVGKYAAGAAATLFGSQLAGGASPYGYAPAASYVPAGYATPDNPIVGGIGSGGPAGASDEGGISYLGGPDTSGGSYDTTDYGQAQQAKYPAMPNKGLSAAQGVMAGGGALGVLLLLNRLKTRTSSKRKA